MQIEHCIDCGAELLVGVNFARSRKARYIKLCSACGTKRGRRWRKANPEQVRMYYWKRQGIENASIDYYNELFASQKGLCAICKNPPYRNHALALDHNHKTGQLRALLCKRCNVALSALESPLFNAYQEYLKEWSRLG
jgi:hypothetical protein